MCLSPDSRCLKKKIDVILKAKKKNGSTDIHTHTNDRENKYGVMHALFTLF